MSGGVKNNFNFFGSGYAGLGYADKFPAIAPQSCCQALGCW